MRILKRLFQDPREMESMKCHQFPWCHQHKIQKCEPNKSFVIKTQQKQGRSQWGKGAGAMPPLPTSLPDTNKVQQFQ